MYSGSQGFANPRLLFPHLNLSLVEDKESKADVNKSGVDVEASCSQSEILRRSLTRLSCESFRYLLLFLRKGAIDININTIIDIVGAKARKGSIDYVYI